MQSKTLVLCLFFLITTAWADEWNVEVSLGTWKKGQFQPAEVLLTGVPYALRIRILQKGKLLASFHDSLEVQGLYTSTDTGELVPLGSTGSFTSGLCQVYPVYLAGDFSLYYQGKLVYHWTSEEPLWFGWVSLFPPLFAIFLALWLKDVVISLFLGIWLGAFFLCQGNLFSSFLRTLDQHIVQALADPDHIKIVLFSLMLGGLVSILYQGRFIHALVNYWREKAKERRSGQLTTWGMGLFIFFDDYANTLLVGQTMRPLTDSLSISREKLAYLVDSTAAPVASLAILSTWIGVELAYLNDYFSFYPQGASPRSSFSVFLSMLPYRFYSIFTLLFVFLIAYTLRDFGPMLRAERRAKTGEVLRKDSTPLGEELPLLPLSQEPKGIPWFSAFFPIGLTIFATFFGLLYDGWQNSPAHASLLQIIGNADSLKVLLWSSTLGVICAAALARYFSSLTLSQILQSWLMGAKSMFFALLVLTLAWALGDICTKLRTGDFIVEISKGAIPPFLLPALVFLIAGVTAFATGTSWGTMGILLPLVIPMSGELLAQAGHISSQQATPYGWEILLATTAAVLAGASFGDHCSPISDTTIMSSMASGCDHLDHVRTQLPYAFTTAGASLFSYISLGLGLPLWACLILGVFALLFLLHWLGEKA